MRITFIWQGKRRRETLQGIEATPANIKFAARKRGEIINQIERGTFDYATHFPNSKIGKANGPVPEVRYPMTDLIDRFIDHGRDTGSLSPSTLGSYVRWNNSRLKKEFAAKYVDQITTMDLETWIVGMTKELAPKSIRTIVGIVAKVLRKAHAAHPPLIPSNPMSPITLGDLLPKPKIKETIEADDLVDHEFDDVDPFNRDEIAAILQACLRIHTRALFQFAFATGLRTGELIALKWRHIDWVNGVIRVRHNIVTGEKGVTVEKTTKTDEIRDVPMLPSAREALEWMKPISMMKNLQGKDYIFTPDGTNRWRNERQIRSHWTTTLRKAGVRYRNPYNTRHTFASTLLMNKEPELLVAHLLGHANVEMVRRHYGKYIKETGGIKLRGTYDDFSGKIAAPRGAKWG